MPAAVAKSRHEAHDGAGAGSLSRRPPRRDAARRAAAVRRRVGDLRPRQRGGDRRSAVSPSQRAAHVSRAQRAGDGARRNRVCQSEIPPAHDGLHDVDRSRRHQSRDRRGARARQSPAGAVASRRHLHLARAGSRPAAGRGLRGRHDQRQRLLPARVALLRPHRSSGAASDCAAASGAGAHRSRAVRSGRRSRCRRTCRRWRTTIRTISSRRRSSPSLQTRRHRRRSPKRRRSCARRSGRCSSPAAACCTGSPAMRCARSPSRTGFRLRKRRPARARCRGTIRCNKARSASRGRLPPTRWPRTPTWCSPIGTRLSDFTTGSHSLFAPGAPRQSQRQRVRRAQVARRANS